MASPNCNTFSASKSKLIKKDSKKIKEEINIKSYENGKAKWTKKSKYFNPFLKKKKRLYDRLKSLKVSWQAGSDKLLLRK